MSLEYTLEGFNLHQPELGFRLLEGTEFASNIAPRRVNIVLPGVHGEIPAWNDPLSTTTLLLHVRIQGENAEDLRTKWNYLRSLTRVGSNNPVTIRRVTQGQTLVASVQLESMSTPDFHCAVNMVTTTMTFHNPRGRWEDVNASEQALAVPGTDQNVVFAAQSSAPVDNALVRVRGPITSITVRDNTSDTGFHWQGPPNISSSQYLLVDCAMFTAWRNTDEEWDTRDEDVSSELVTTGNGMLSLVPIPAFIIGSSTNSTTITASGTTGDTVLTIRGRRTYI